MPRILYLHGFASGPASRKARWFAERWPGVETPNLVEGPFRDLTITAQLRVVEREARGEPVCLIGSSLGGYLAALYADRHPEVVRVVLLAPAFGFARRWAASLGAEMLRDWARSGALEVPHYATGTTAVIGWQLIEDGRAYPDEPEIRQPALIFHGRNDVVVPARGSQTYARGRPNVTLRLLESGHELLDVFETVYTETRRFLESP